MGALGKTITGIAIGTAIGATIVASKGMSGKKSAKAKKMNRGGNGMKRKAGNAMHSAAGFIDNIATMMK